MEENLTAQYKKIRHVLIAVLVLNWAVAFAKIFYGLFIRSSGVTADGFHSLSDGFSNVIGLVGIALAYQPRDGDHPYGHKKYETLFSLAIAAALLFVSFNLLWEGFARLYNPVQPRVDAVSFVVMTATLIINVFVMKYEMKKGAALQSDILIADAMHTKADVLTTVSVMAALGAAMLGYPLADAIVTILIALFIVYCAAEIIRQSSRVLCDTAVIIDVKNLEKVVLAVKGVKACHKIRTRGRCDDINIDLHVQVSPQMHVDSAHKISYEIEYAIKRSIPGVTDVVVHIEPDKKEKAKR